MPEPGHRRPWKELRRSERTLGGRFVRQVAVPREGRDPDPLNRKAHPTTRTNEDSWGAIHTGREALMDCPSDEKSPDEHCLGPLPYTPRRDGLGDGVDNRVTVGGIEARTCLKGGLRQDLESKGLIGESAGRVSTTHRPTKGTHAPKSHAGQ
ncbi:hypothetical protein GWK47_021406 [Chionoecetes opilio]|uniref:Uncharacterized protein n=1 Tax=Chionoecetes opilio TaxID=41210 RepID=A0A8J4XNQ4_CHIOP|nr:hypothetical protein GWK47_021406 [Chionoecetes opilio]